MKAVTCQNIQIVKVLLDAGANTNIKDKEGTTALMNASYYGYTEIVETLLSAGADVNAVDKDGYTARDYATMKFNTITRLIDSAGQRNRR